MKKYFLVLILLGALLLGIGPWVAGTQFQRKYLELIDFLNAQPGIHIEQVSYDRGWFYSTATLSVEISTAKVINALEMIGLSKKASADSFHINIQQKIQHGPVLYQMIPSHPFGLAAIHNRLKVKEASTIVFDDSDDRVTFTGAYFHQMRLKNFQVDFPNDARLTLGQLESTMWIWPLQYRIQGKINLHDLLFSREKNYFSIPFMTMQFKQQKSSLWLGSMNAGISEINWHWEGMPKVTASQIKFGGKLEETKGKLNGDREISFEKMQVNNDVVGPFHLRISLHDLNAATLRAMFSTYQEVKARGEYYQTELENKISTLIPQLVTPGTTVNIDQLDLMTAYGRLNIRANVHWPIEGFVLQESIMEMLDASNMQATIVVSKKLANQLLVLAANTPYFRADMEDAKAELIGLEAETTIALQQNALWLADLVARQQLSDSVALELVEIQKVDSDGEIYLAKVKDLYLNRKITQEVAYQLFIEYANVLNHVRKLVQRLDNPQQETLRQLQVQLQEWLKAGLISQRDDDYSTVITRNQGVLKVNGRGM